MTSTRLGRAFAVLPPLTHELAEAIPVYAAAVAPLAEQVAHTLARTSPRQDQPERATEPCQHHQRAGPREAQRQPTGNWD